MIWAALQFSSVVSSNGKSRSSAFFALLAGSEFHGIYCSNRIRGRQRARRAATPSPTDATSRSACSRIGAQSGGLPHEPAGQDHRLSARCGPLRSRGRPQDHRRRRGKRKAYGPRHAKLTEQAKYVVWRDGVVERGGNRGNQHTGGQISERKSSLPDADPGAFIVHKWRKKFCTKGEIDEEKIKAPLSWRFGTGGFVHRVRPKENSVREFSFRHGGARWCQAERIQGPGGDSKIIVPSDWNNDFKVGSAKASDGLMLPSGKHQCSRPGGERQCFLSRKQQRPQPKIPGREIIGP